MSLLVAVLHRRVWPIALLIALPLVGSCRTEYTGQYFSFPPSSKPHEGDWQYTALVTVTSGHTPISDKSSKKVNVKVYDKNEKVFLNDDFKFVSASIRATVAWDDFEELTVELTEVGNEYAKDNYNRELVRAGPNKLLAVKYKFDPEDKKFKKVP